MEQQEIMWTIQTPSAWRELKTRGVLTGKRTEGTWPEFRSAYEWMIRQMISRIGNPPRKNAMPIWAWYRWEGRAKWPDLRARYSKAGESLVLIEFMPDWKQVLLSDFDLWHYVLNEWHLPKDKTEERRIEELRRLSGQPVQASLGVEMKMRWERIFDLENRTAYSCPKAKQSIQATLWTIRLDQVRWARAFRSK